MTNVIALHGTPEGRRVLRSRREMIPTWVSQAEETPRKALRGSLSMPGLERKGTAHAGDLPRKALRQSKARRPSAACSAR